MYIKYEVIQYYNEHCSTIRHSQVVYKSVQTIVQKAFNRRQQLRQRWHHLTN